MFSLLSGDPGIQAFSSLSHRKKFRWLFFLRVVFYLWDGGVLPCIKNPDPVIFFRKIS